MLYLLPAFVFLGVFLFYPMFKTLYFSFFEVGGNGQVGEFVGWDHYIELTKSEEFRKSMKGTFLFVLYTVPAEIIIAFFLAVLASEKLKGIGFFITIFSSTMGVSVAAVATIFLFLFYPSLCVLIIVFGFFFILLFFLFPFFDGFFNLLSWFVCYFLSCVSEFLCLGSLFRCYVICFHSSLY